MTETSELTASDGAANDDLGNSVAVSGDTVVAGAPFRQVGSNTYQGAAYVFVMPSGGWPATMTQTSELTASDGAANDQLGDSVAVSGNTVVAGAPHPGGSPTGSPGAAYVFARPGPTASIASPADEATYEQQADRDRSGPRPHLNAAATIAATPAIAISETRRRSGLGPRRRCECDPTVGAGYTSALVATPSSIVTGGQHPSSWL
jgi:hypothetical protein